MPNSVKIKISLHLAWKVGEIEGIANGTPHPKIKFRCAFFSTSAQT